MLRWRRSVPLRWSLAPDAPAAIGLLAASLIFYYPLVFLGRVLVDYDAFGGFAVGQVGHLNQISAAAWLPAVLLAYDRFARSQKVYWLALGALALAMELLAGHPQETYMTLIVLGIFGVVGAPWRSPRNLVWCAIGGAGMCALGGGLSAA